MRWSAETFEQKAKRLREWRLWFAWYPVRIGTERVWLEKVYRRTKIYYGGMGDILYEREYADMMSMLKKDKAEQDYDGLE